MVSNFAGKTVQFGSAACIVLLLCSIADAEFTNSTERFNGDQLDTSTWTRRTEWANLGQHDALNLDNGEICTKTLQIDPGWSVRAEIVCSRMPQFDNQGGGIVSLALSTRDLDRQTYELDSFFTSIEMGLTADHQRDSFIAWMGGSGQGTGLHLHPLEDSAAILGTTYILQIDRISQRQFSYSIFDDGADLLGSLKVTNRVDIYDPIYISLSANGVSAAMFDNVTIAPIPEPATLVLLTLGMAILRPRWRS